MITTDRPAVWSHVDEAADDQAYGVLLIHGQPGSALIWNRVRPLLRTLGLRVVSVDRPGYGHSAGRALDQLGNAAVITEMLDEQPDHPMIVVGHSLGAGIAIALAATAPRHVQALVLVAPAAGPAAITATDHALAAPVIGPALSWLGFRLVGLALHIPALRRRILRDRVGLTPTDADEVVRRVSRGDVWRSFTAEQRHLMIDAHLLQQSLRRVTCPVVIVAGTHDRIARPNVIAAISRQLPEAKLLTTDTGHLIPIDDPDTVVDGVLHAVRLQYRSSPAAKRSTR